MSRGATTNSRDRDTATVANNKLSHARTTTQLDEQLHHLRETTLPPYPYLLSVPSDVPYRHSSRFVNTWHEGTPFESSEEQLQYLSFLPHLGDHESLLKVEGGWADDQGNPVSEEDLSPKALPASGRQTPAESGQRKKISLQDYKTKGKSPPAAIPRPEPVKPVQKPAPPVVVTKKEPVVEYVSVKKDKDESRALSHANGTAAPAQKTAVTNGTKPARPAQLPNKVHHADSVNPAKRRKLSPPPEELKPTSRSPKMEAVVSASKMPKLLSPTLPSPEKESGMPTLLSPLLPPSLAKELGTPPSGTAIGSPASAQAKRSDGVRAILAGADLDNSGGSDPSKLAPGGNRVRSDSQNSARPSAPGTPLAAKAIMTKNGSRTGTPVQNGTRSPGPRQRRTIVLKYGKKNRKRVEGLLRFAPRPEKVPVQREVVPSVVKKEPSRHDSITETKLKPSLLDDSKVEKKRKTEDSPAPPAKKIRSVEAEKRPATPVPPAARTPLSSQPRSTFSTPKKDPRSTAMRRVESADGSDAPTPHDDKLRVSTPQPGPKPSPQPPASSSTTSSTTRHQEKAEEKQAWLTLNDKYFQMGRKIKHEGTALLNNTGSDKPPPPTAILSLIEALLCFMINIQCSSLARPNVETGWRTILPYHVFVLRATPRRQFPHLHALVVQMGAVCRQILHKHDVERLARDPLPEDYAGNSAPTPGSDGNTRTSEDMERYKKSYTTFKADLVQNFNDLQIAWSEAPKVLSTEVLRREYAGVWEMQAQGETERGWVRPVPSSIPKEFCLPVDPSTTAFEAARFGVAFLEEWAGKEGVKEWRCRIDL